jgi:hypothetical protein
MFIELTKIWQSKPPGERLDLPDADAQKLIEDGHAKALDHDPIAQAIDAAMARAQAQFDAAMGEASGDTGGYTVPPDFYNQLLAIIVGILAD